jgi:hypothetical protein
MEGLLYTQTDSAEERGRKMLESEPRASAARYDRETGRIEMDLVNGCLYAFPTELVQDLQGADPDALAVVEVDGLGFNLHFPVLDVDLYVPLVVAGLFGTRAWMARALAQMAGRTSSVAKAAAARANGAKGGRPRKAPAE